ncbi:diphosphate--fructose-6-phosphate 1-phosphotransferase [Blastopirellula sp. J2-11]|uniref:diphosphate--fructose-6-phosphate 1-phosphotransferase n=1 Tax=Blastopirellula sp. J2-11 TaxID=2943192 RepID=UPI0021C93A5E|nr:diphosphate--fructose-6-phosphate 1-phosphotransferase [Blastopirellula sp. J2-11]UUO08896.1 diphosphate--fructose-6-phosphate 1-phosphotransferase [Blastopirellula sp. J2-11]
MSAPKNMIVAQSGGPSPVINNTLRGIIEMASDLDNIGTVYGAHHGIEGVLKEELINLSDQPADEISLLRYTPAAGSIGTCRYKLKDWQNEDFDRVIEVFKAHNIGYFIYIGGNDSMDTANKMALMAQERGLDLIGIGGPKTIDNDVGDSEFKLIDHTPGYASTAKYWMHMVQYANEENQGSSPADPVLVMQAMGRKIGYIPAAARLADPHREMPLQIYLAESPCSLEELHQNVNEQLKKDGRCMVVISEGFNVGDIGEVKDSFGHTSFSSSQITVAQTVTNYLNQNGLAAKGAARCNVSGTDQRHAMAYASSVDLDEAYHAGQKAALLASKRESGFMSTILRNDGPVYSVRYDKAPLAEVANSERTFPKEWITANGYDVTDDFIRYAKPLLGEGMVSLPMVDGRQRMTRLQPLFADQKLAAYVPQADRQKAPK